MKLLIVTDCSFPGSAMASRILSFKSLFVELGYEVLILSTKTTNKDIELDKEIEEKNYTYEIVGSKRSYRLQSFLGNERLKRIVEEKIEKESIDLVFSTSLGSNFNEILDICKKHNVKLILEQCEWFDYSSYGLKKIDPRYIRFNNNIKNNFIKADGIIAISRLLEDYYKKQNVKTIRIPSILDIKNKPFSNKLNNEKINLVFTGNTSNSKELLKPVMEVLNESKYLNKFIFNIYGASKDEVINNIGDETLINKNININGYVEQNRIEDILLKSDYQIFIRPNRRSSNAGFPTKLAESMAVGTPVITNNTGDISLYLKDEYNGYICNGNSKEDVMKVFDKILNNQSNLRIAARKTAEESFDYRLYKELVKYFIKTL